MCFENGILFENIISVNDSMISKELVKNNLGLCFVNKDFFKEEIANGDIKEILLFSQTLFVLFFIFVLNKLAFKDRVMIS